MPRSAQVGYQVCIDQAIGREPANPKLKVSSQKSMDRTPRDKAVMANG